MCAGKLLQDCRQSSFGQQSQALVPSLNPIKITIYWLLMK
jgi:hypothetical protein